MSRQEKNRNRDRAYAGKRSMSLLDKYMEMKFHLTFECSPLLSAREATFNSDLFKQEWERYEASCLSIVAEALLTDETSFLEVVPLVETQIPVVPTDIIEMIPAPQSLNDVSTDEELTSPGFIPLCSSSNQQQRFDTGNSVIPSNYGVYHPLNSRLRNVGINATYEPPPSTAGTCDQCGRECALCTCSSIPVTASLPSNTIDKCPDDTLTIIKSMSSKRFKPLVDDQLLNVINIILLFHPNYLSCSDRLNLERAIGMQLAPRHRQYHPFYCDFYTSTKSEYLIVSAMRNCLCATYFGKHFYSMSELDLYWLGHVANRIIPSVGRSKEFTSRRMVCQTVAHLLKWEKDSPGDRHAISL